MSDNESVETTQEEAETTISLEAKDMRKKKERKPYTMSEAARAKRLENLEKAKAKNKLIQEERDRAKLAELKSKYEAKAEAEAEEQAEEEPAPEVKRKPSTKSKAKRRVIVEESDSDSSSEEEVIVRRKKGSRKPKLDEAKLYEMELERRLKLREEHDELKKMEKEALQRRYKEKLKEAKQAQFNTFMFPGGDYDWRKNLRSR